MKSAHYVAVARAAASSIASTKQPPIARPARHSKAHLALRRLLRRKGLVTRSNLLRRAHPDLKHTLQPSERTRRRHHTNRHLIQCRHRTLQQRPTPQQQVVIHILCLKEPCRLRLWTPVRLPTTIKTNTHSHSHSLVIRVCRREKKVLTRGFLDAEGAV